MSHEPNTKLCFFFQGLMNIYPKYHPLHHSTCLHRQPGWIKRLLRWPRSVGNGFRKIGKWMKTITWIKMDGSMVAGTGRPGVPSLLAYACSHDADTGLEMHDLLKSLWAVKILCRSASSQRNQIHAHRSLPRFLQKTRSYALHLPMAPCFKNHPPPPRVNTLWNRLFSPTIQMWKHSYGYAVNENTFFPCIILFLFLLVLFLPKKNVFLLYHYYKLYTY